MVRRKANRSNNESRLLQQSKRGILNIIFSRSMLIVLLLLANFFLLFSFLIGLFEGLPIFTGSLVVFIAAMMVHILNSDDHPSMKLSWCAIIAVLPFFGAALYWYTRWDLGHRLGKKTVNNSIRSSLPYIPEQQELRRQLRQEDRELSNLVHYLYHQGNAAIYSGTDVTYFPSGEDKFREMLIQLEKAEKFIFMEYFIIDQGQMWGQILDLLLRKAKEGVEVRVMYDGTCAITTLPYNYPQHLEQLGIRCKMFSPVRPFISTHYNYRDHRKILVIDGHTAFTGGINLADEYINVRKRHGHWKDTAVMVQGPAVQGFTTLFLQLWNQSEKEHIYEPYLALPPARPTGGYVIPYGCGPNVPERVGEMVYLNILNQAKDYVYIMTPYLILDSEMITGLCSAARRGVDVRIILPHIPDKHSVFALAKSHYRELISAGVNIYEYTPGFIHAKVFLSDDKCGVVGTINLDYRSLYHHYECAAYLQGVPALADIRTDFQETMEKSQRVTMEDVKKQSPLTRLMAALLKAAAPLM